MAEPAHQSWRVRTLIPSLLYATCEAESNGFSPHGNCMGADFPAHTVSGGGVTPGVPGYLLYFVILFDFSMLYRVHVQSLYV